MDLLFRLLERRVIIAIAVVLAAVWAGERWGGYAENSADMLLHPPADAVSPLSADIIKTSEARESAKLRGLHRAVSAEIAAAAANGFNVEKFQRLAKLGVDGRAGIKTWRALEAWMTNDPVP